LFSEHRRAVGVRVALVAMLTAALALAPSGVAQAKTKRDLKVMTQNLYLGSSLDPALQAQTAAQFFGAVVQIYGTVQQTNFPARSDAIADEIQAEEPDVIGLQEVTRWTSTGPGAPPSQDFLSILQQDLADRGLSYSAAAVSDNADVGPVPLASPLCSGDFGDCTVRLQDRDVILVNDDASGLTVSNPKSGQYATQEVLTTPVGPLSFDRGWASIDGTLDGKSFHLANTHLEVEGFPATQQAQGREFLRGPAKGVGAVIATGDFNSAADGSTTTTYANLTKSYFSDAWATNPGDPGYSCCQNSPLTNTTSALSSRIDLVLTHGASQALSASLIGDTPFQASQPLWPSDHAGVVANVRIH
jgi:endonuclease/exonuclease/phosphatase family metal-dependent hydrolase